MAMCGRPDKGEKAESVKVILAIIPTDDPLTIPKTTNSGAMLTTKKSGRQSPRLAADEDGFLDLIDWTRPTDWPLFLQFLQVPPDLRRLQSPRKAIANALHFIKHDPFDYYAPFWWPRISICDIGLMEVIAALFGHATCHV